MNYAGIDFGTTNSYLALVGPSSPKIMPTFSGERAVRSVLLDEGNELYSIKRYLGRSPEELDDLGLEYILDKGTLRVVWRGIAFSPEELAAEVFAKILEETRAPLPLSAVLAVPAHYDEAQRRAAQKAGEMAGIDIIRLIHEPTAAALAFGGDKEKVIVFDFGGGTLDVSLLEINEDIFEVLKTTGNRNLGGDDLDLLLAVEVARRLEVSFSREVLLASRQVKHELSGREGTIVVLGDSQLEITRPELEQIAAPFLFEVKNTLQEFAKEKADRLLLVGGMSRMPAVAALAEEVLSLPAESISEPESAVALGAARYMQALKGENDALLIDITPMSLGVEVEGKGYSVLLPGGSKMPTSCERLFSTSRDNQSSVEINILQGEEKDPSQNRHLGRIWLRGIPAAPAGVPELWVSFQINESGILSVFAASAESKEELIIDLADH